MCKCDGDLRDRRYFKPINVVLTINPELKVEEVKKAMDKIKAELQKPCSILEFSEELTGEEVNYNIALNTIRSLALDIDQTAQVRLDASKMLLEHT